jgi:hypothetical protein
MTKRQKWRDTPCVLLQQVIDRGYLIKGELRNVFEAEHHRLLAIWEQCQRLSGKDGVHRFAALPPKFIMKSQGWPRRRISEMYTEVDRPRRSLSVIKLCWIK